MTIEDRLRRAIDDRTSSVDVDERAGLDAITNRLLNQGGTVDLRSPRTRWLLAAAAAVVLVAAVGGGLLLSRDDPDDKVDISDETPTTEPPPPETTEADTPDTTVEEPPSSTASTTPTSEPDIVDEVEARAIWPRPSSEVRFDDPVGAARSFALYYARFGDPVIGEFRQGDNRSGEVPVQPRPDAPETTVLVRQSSQGEWFVIGSITENISVERPTAGSTLSCPMVASGTALAFEGTVQVRIDAYQPDGDRVEMGSGFVTGGGGPAAPFSGQINCTVPTGVEDYGIATFFTADESEQTTGPWEIVTIPVLLP